MRKVGKRKIIQLRYQEAIFCLHHAYFHASVLVACSGIELLLQALYDELRKDVNAGYLLPKSLEREKDELIKRKGSESKWTMGDWIYIYRKCKLIPELNARFNFNFMRFNDQRLKHANDIWVACKHEFKQAEAKDAKKVCTYLKHFLEECHFPSHANAPARARIIDEFGERWLDEWRAEIERWLEVNDAHVALPLMEYMTQLLELALKLIQDDKVLVRHRTQLMVAANYVISSVDLMPEDQFEVRGLVDDSAVLILTLSWLLRQVGFEAEALRSHWQGEKDVIIVVEQLEAHIRDKRDTLFAGLRADISGNLVWATLRRVATDGPEALWQNYWAEAY